MSGPPAGAIRAAVVATVAAAAGLIAALVLGGAVTEKIIPGLGDAGELTRWGLPLARLAMDIGAVLTVGALLAATVLLPSERAKGTNMLGPSALGYLRAASWLAAGWATAAAATLILTVSDILGEPVGKVVSGSELSSYIGQLPQGTALMFVVMLTAVVALLARTATTAGSSLGLLLLAGVALLPPPLNGHSASSPNHSVATVGLALHIAAITPWVGGLAVLCWHAWKEPGRGSGGGELHVAAERFSRMALWCYIAVGVSGLANVISRLPDPTELFTSAYGRLVLAKIAAYAVLGWFGWWHRRRTLPAVAARKPGAFARLASVEAAVMAATMGLAVALSRTAPPVVDSTGGTAKELLGYDMPPPITVERLLTLWRFDLFFALLIIVLGGVYLAGIRRLRKRGDSWPVGRTVAWLAGLVSIAAVTLSGVATYAPVLFSVHMAQHMVLAMLTPIFLVLGAPVTLALRALKPAATRGDRGPREWLTVFLHSRAAKVVTHPTVATAIFIVSTYALYFSPLFEQAMRAHLGHIAMLSHFMLSGILFFWVLIGIDPAPTRLPYIGRLLVLFVTMPFHAFFGIAIMNMGKPLAEGWYTALDRPWGASLVSDQSTGGAMAWAFGEIPTFIVLLALVFQWFVEDERLARRLERKADRAEARKENDELSDYNAYLASLDRRSGRKAATPAAAGAAEAPRTGGTGDGARDQPEPAEKVAEATDGGDPRE
ncbi:bifunctional copper resistance protein CopD/cytochrome c oxidase assembly protein [Actinomadura alba]|uniref:Bifunctional copper resistance protein CopD/cytochrome c oxidase assembly protein n=1 Tax=Actinomadura alba TaxID=406431 RepID=A0ABR7LLP5_9ACTN|nr:bifunctional copper resistance protein CopD/cytochrome c oxidase assembly protein [Actinomadura alba]MBC6465313.1 bifunctional copper resistance protein CopD/cytochrome c oxidase assembly protein [Actinomadura alba]